MASISSRNHVIIVNFPNQARVQELLDAIQTAELDTEILMVSSSLQKLPFHASRVDLVNGSVTSLDTYKRADIDKAKRVLVLRHSEDPTASDSVVAAIVSLLKNHYPSLYIAAECLAKEHTEIMQRAGADSIIYAYSVLNNLLSQSLLDPGAAEIMEQLSDKISKIAIYRTPIGKLPKGYCTYPLFAKRMLDKGYTVLAMRRQKESHLKLQGQTLKQGDEVYYIGKHRVNWIEIKSVAKAPD